MIAATVENCIDFECLGIQYLGDNDIDFDLLFRIGDDIVYLDVYSGGQRTTQLEKKEKKGYPGARWYCSLTVP